MTEKTAIRIVIVDDQAIVRSGLGAFLMSYDDFELLGEATNGEEAIQLCDLVAPHVVLMDLTMPVLDGISATALIRQRWPNIKVIMISSHSEIDLVKAALEAGAGSYLLKDVSAHELSNAIRQVFNDGPVISPVPLEPEKPPDASNRPPLTGISLVQEVATAGQIQAELLPLEPPRLPGWDICARLEPARVASGDFYDFIPLANNNWGILIADVSDKGIGAALFMALCSTLIRTYAIEYATVPALALSHVNERLLSDSRSEMYVTVFYGVLEPDTGRLRYVNAGHNPPILVSSNKGRPSLSQLSATGMALGVLEDATWKQKVIRFSQDDLLLLYTDGITESQNLAGEFYGEDRLLDLLRRRRGHAAKDVQMAVAKDFQYFTRGIPQQDDYALMVVRRRGED